MDDMEQIIREANQEMARLEQEHEQHEQFLGTVSNNISKSNLSIDKPDSNIQKDEYVSGRQLADQLSQLRKKTTRSSQPVELMEGPAMLHGQVQSARNLSVARGTCDPFVKVSYVPPSEEENTPNLMLRAKQKVHTTETVSDTAYPTWTESTFNLEVEEPMTLTASNDWDLLRGDLLFAVYDNNDGTRNEFIGQVIFPLRSLVDGLSSADVRGGSQHLHDLWCPLVGRRSSSSTVGEKPQPDEPALHLVMQLILPGSTQDMSPRGYDVSNLVRPNARTPGSGKSKYQNNNNMPPTNIEQAVNLGIDDDQDFDEYNEYGNNNDNNNNNNNTSNNTQDVESKNKQDRSKLRKRLKQKSKKSSRPKFRGKFEVANRIEQARIVRENLINQKHLQKTRNGAGAGYGKIIRKTKAQMFMEQSSAQAQARMKKRLEKDNEFVYARINKMRGEVKPKPPSKEAWELDDEDRQERQDQITRDQRSATARYRIAADLTHQLEQLRGEASTLKSDISTLQTKAQRYETATRRARKAIDEANISTTNREAALSRGPTRKRESALPNGAKSIASLVPGSRDSEFTKRFGRSNGGSSSKYNNDEEEDEDDTIDYERLDELRGELAERLQTYEMVEGRRKRYIEQAKVDRETALQLEKQLVVLEGERDKVRARREWTAKYATDASNDVIETKTSRSIGIDSEHEKLLDAKNKLTAVQIDVSALEFELEDLKREHSYDIGHMTEQANEMELKIQRKQTQLKKESSLRQQIQEKVSQAQKSGRIEELQVTIRNMRNAELLCRHAAKNRDTFEDEANSRVKRSQQNFDKKLKNRDVVDKSSGFSL
tara:strand:+ start:116 stop:2599 length:2484 start_codon:yes stop_codon:yes gene_type:complete